MLNGKPIICITSDSDASKNTGTPRKLICPKAYLTAIGKAGGVPLLAGEYCAEELAELCDGLLLSGGDDVCPERFGETALNETVSVDPARDAFEWEIIPEFIKRKKPILCICRGMQVLNIYMGGDIYQDLVEQMGIVHMNSKIRHRIFNEKGSLLYELFGDSVAVNSTHHQAVRTVAEGFRVTSKSIEGIIEAMEHKTLPIYCYQFHPERLSFGSNDGRTPDFDSVFFRFIKLCAENADK